MTSPALAEGEICAALFAMAEENKWHWTICVPVNPTTVQKFHAKQLTPGIWMYERSPDVLEEAKTCCAVIKIGSLKSGSSVDVVNELLRAIPMSTPAIDSEREPRFTCRVWFRGAVRALNENGIISCSDVDGLEEECKKIAMTNDLSKKEGGYTYSSASQSS